MGSNPLPVRATPPSIELAGLPVDLEVLPPRGTLGALLGHRLPMFFLPTRDVLLGLTLSIALGLLTGIFPARTAIKLRVADALRRM